MEIQILVSKKGTQVVTTSNLHQVLQLPDHKYNGNVEKWIGNIYAFRDDIRAPKDLKDYSRRHFQHSKLKDFYISVEMALLITLNSDSTVKQSIARKLRSIHTEQQKEALLSKEQVLAVLELTKVMGLVSCQKSVERQHMRHFESNNGSTYKWWNYRAQLLGYSAEELKGKMKEVGKNFKGKNLLQLLMNTDKYEIVRMSVIDLFMALGKSKAYAQSMGDLAKVFAVEMKVQIWDDRNSDINFIAADLNAELVSELKNFRFGTSLSALEAA